MQNKRGYIGKHEQGMVKGFGSLWQNLENQPCFRTMRLLSIIYIILAGGVNAYLYLFLLLGLNKFSINHYAYEWGILAFIYIVLKLQPKLMGLAMFGFGAWAWFLSSTFSFIGYM